MLDIVIIGAGPAGLTAALYATRAGHSVLLLESLAPGGQAVNTPHVENWPGTHIITGPQFAVNLYEQAKSLGIPIKTEKALGIKTHNGTKIVITEGGSYPCRSVIVASALNRRKLQVPGEDTYAGRGVSYCAVCDGNFFKDKDVAVVGGGNTAAEDAIYLSSICKQVYLIHRHDRLSAEAILAERVMRISNVECLLHRTVNRIEGRTKMETVYLDGGEQTEVLNLNGLFVAIGYSPDNAKFEPLLKLDKDGYIIADEGCRTLVPGVFAAGDCRSKELRQLVTAASDGAIAATNAGKYLLLATSIMTD